MRTTLVALTLALAASACSSKSHDDQLSASDARDVLINRNWMDRTLFKGTFELFMFKVERGDHIVFDLPETHERVTSQFQIERVAGPQPFDLKLTIFSDPRGPHVYYGMRAETDRDGHLLEERLAAQR